MADPLFRAIDCLQLPVRDLDASVAFYGDRLGHRLVRLVLVDMSRGPIGAARAEPRADAATRRR